MAASLSKLLAIRNGFHRTPCAPDDERYRDFEARFSFEATVDQQKCFEVRTMISLYVQ